MHRCHRTIPLALVHKPRQQAAAHLKTDNFICQVVMKCLMMGETIIGHPSLIYDNVEKDYLYYTPNHCNFVALFANPN